ncbi:MAG: MoxR family ATPase [Chloroflexi bacterium]|nr:MoxR family ATPase [Chloroflexota bacterium]
MRIQANIAQVIVGKEDVVQLLLVALLCEGHVLIEDVPGIGKTTLAKALARSLDCTFRRIQFTPDLLPTDVTGVSVWDSRTGEFVFRPGPVFAQVVLADEINRASPRTQSALLEAMQERQVTVDGISRLLERPFLVLATQNPVELEGTFPLPEAQLDRFLMRVSLGYPDRETEREILRRFGSAATRDDPLLRLEPVADGASVLANVALARRVFVGEAVASYLLSLAEATRHHEDLALGVSPRATLALYQTAQALAALQGRGYVLPDDVQRLVEPTWAHRLIPVTRQRLHGVDAAEILRKIVAQVPVPVEESWSEKAVP